jgi:CheY-like chemotaxis protein
MANILILDDNRALLDLMTVVLTRAGHHVVGVLDGASALERLAQERFEITIADLVMDGIGGGQVMQMIRPRYPSIKLIAISGAVAAESAVALGADMALTKPFRPRALVEAVTELLAGAGQRH